MLEVLRQPLEDKLVTISRAQGSLTFPASFQLVAAMNPCPCGYAGDPVKPCSCSPGMVTKYQKRISGPLLDRIDIHISVPRVEYDKLSDKRVGEPSQVVRARVEGARDRQRARFKAGEGVSSNADMRPAEVRVYCALDATGTSLMKAAMSQMQLSARAYHRVLKLARTIADLAGAERSRRSTWRRRCSIGRGEGRIKKDVVMIINASVLIAPNSTNPPIKNWMDYW